MHMSEAKGWKGWLLWCTQTVRHFTLAGENDASQDYGGMWVHVALLKEFMSCSARQVFGLSIQPADKNYQACRSNNRQQLPALDCKSATRHTVTGRAGDPARRDAGQLHSKLQRQRMNV